jgi:hypothetical protein
VSFQPFLTVLSPIEASTEEPVAASQVSRLSTKRAAPSARRQAIDELSSA